MKVSGWLTPATYARQSAPDSKRSCYSRRGDVGTKPLLFCAAGFKHTSTLVSLRQLMLNQVEEKTRRLGLVAGRGFEPLTFGL